MQLVLQEIIIKKHPVNSIDAMPGRDGLIIGDDGSLRFTAQYKPRIARYFRLAGIDVESVDTVDKYIAARAAASPYFEDWIVSELASKELTLERRLVIATFLRDKREVRKLKMQIDTQRIESRGL